MANYKTTIQDAENDLLVWTFSNRLINKTVIPAKKEKKSKINYARANEFMYQYVYNQCFYNINHAK